MGVLLGSVAAYTVVATLLVTGVGHLTRPAALTRALAAHRVLPAPAAVAGLVVTAELLLAGAGVVALRGDDGRALRIAVGVAAAGLLGLYAGYGRHVLSTGRTGPCGCSRRELPMSGWVVARAAVLSGLALLGAVLSGSVLGWGRLAADLAVVLLAAATFTVGLWQLPAAMYHPRPVRPARGDLSG
ncbi:MauE/DoxX family redox-associated membrane protein [Micromonospora cathayae]|uniref:Methylamine utilisation protein MauE domain-containing protein n=1 Tax=Micromonospora cathayae TaxID=3028804 RepID=A0ABY7ZJ53_9ACTN|nr:MauE/DoxX family redox-associated membrane protein [Micromonospora sp. HUAS 3]WDZ82935.1 hypothetical protein PVK37_20960 [Micromonospora sp. HUAS 3]